MLAKAGESDRAIRVKMVRFSTVYFQSGADCSLTSPSICLRVREATEKQTGGEAVESVRTACFVAYIAMRNVGFWCQIEEPFSKTHPPETHKHFFGLHSFVMSSKTLSTTPGSEGIVSKIQDFAYEHKKVVLAVSAAAVATAVAVVLYTNVGRSSIGDVEKGDEKKSSKKKKTKGSKTNKTGPTEPFDPNGPILEEIPKVEGPTCKSSLLLLIIYAYFFSSSYSSSASHRH